MILHRYFAWRFMITLGSVFAIFGLILIFVEIVDRLREFQNVDATFTQILGMALLNLPVGIYRIIPLLIILATIWLFLGLARTSELVVTRSAGRSALRALIAPCLLAFVLGLAVIGILNPIVAATTREYEVREAALKGTDTSFSLASDGLWMRQGSQETQTVIRAGSSNLDGTALSNVTFLTFGVGSGPIRRIDAQSALLANGEWTITNAKVWPLQDVDNPENAAEIFETYTIPSTLTADQIRDSFGTPSSIPIWDLPGFIHRLQTAGFSARRHQVWLQSELAQPLFLIAMVMIGAAFTMRPQRGGRTGLMVMYAILLSFTLYFLRNFALILGENGQIPVLLSAWAPPFGAIGIALGVLLHLEDG